MAERGIWSRARSSPLRSAYALCSIALLAVFPIMSEVVRLGVARLVALVSLAAVVYGASRAGGRPRWWTVLVVVGLILVNVAGLLVLLASGFSVVLGGVFNAVGNVVLFTAGLSVVAGRGRADVGSVIDTAIIGLALGGLAWNFFLLPRQEAVNTPIVPEISAFLAVFALAGILAAFVRLGRTSGPRSSGLWLLSAGLALALGTHVVRALSSDPWRNVPASMLSMAAYTCVGLFGLDPDTHRLVRAGPAIRENLSGSRLLFLGIAVALIPVAFGASALLGGQVNGILLVVGGALVTLLVMVRIRKLVAERQHAEDSVRHLASHDALTGLVNRREFVMEFGDELSRASQSALLFCDLDGFKRINDAFGHSAGDQLLVEVARRLVASVRQSDTVARLGGDEFLVLLRNAGREDVDGVLDRLSAALSEPMAVDSESVSVGASIGVVPSTKGEPEELIRRADHAMYRAKQLEPRTTAVRIVSDY